MLCRFQFEQSLVKNYIFMLHLLLGKFLLRAMASLSCLLFPGPNLLYTNNYDDMLYVFPLCETTLGFDAGVT